MKDLDELLEHYIDQEELHRTEGRRGIENFARIVRTLGYKDFQFYGQLSNGAALGDIFDFLEDNSGCLEVMIEWIGKQNVPEWRENVEAMLEEEPEEEEEEEDAE